MKTLDTLEANKLIAEFMGLDVLYDCFVKHESAPPGKVTRMKYDTSWDWLMPVVERCITEVNIDDNQYSMIHDALWSLNIDSVHSAVVNFITWYNENN